jgi:hypothetical protein
MPVPSTRYHVQCTLYAVPFTLYPLHIALSRICVYAIVFMYVCKLPSCAVVYVCMHVCFDLCVMMSHTYFAVTSMSVCHRIYLYKDVRYCVFVYMLRCVRMCAAELRCSVCMYACRYMCMYIALSCTRIR